MKITNMTLSIESLFSITGLIRPSGLTTKTEHFTCPKIDSAALPIMKPGIPVRATDPITIKSTL